MSKSEPFLEWAGIETPPPLHRSLLVRFATGAYDVACHTGARWILTDIRLPAAQIVSWAEIPPHPKDADEEEEEDGDEAEDAAHLIWIGSAKKPPRGQYVIARLPYGAGGAVYDVARHDGEKWIVADITLDKHQISHWAEIPVAAP